MPARIKPPPISASYLRRSYTAHPPPHPPPHPHSHPHPHLPPHPPTSGTAKLTPTRRLISIHGIDAPKFLQGVTTINIPTLTSEQGGAYACFLTAQGRILFDVFIYPTNRSPTWRATTNFPSDPSYFIECDTASTTALLAHLHRYKLRSKISIRAIQPDEWDVWSLWDDTTHPVNLASHEIDCIDDRTPHFGKRAVLHNGSQPALSTLEPEVPELSVETYRLRRYLLGVPEGQTEIIGGVALPSESCVDYMHGVDYAKGCYVGQELTIRTRHRGVVRKRVLPVTLYRGCAPDELRYEMVDERHPPFGTEIRRVGGKRAVGRWLAGVGNVGLALCRLEAMTDVRVEGGGEEREVGEFEAVWDDGKVKVKAFVPPWHALRSAER